jgi:hypothetical protein
MTTIKVTFPDGPREVPAAYDELAETHYALGFPPPAELSRPCPLPMEGWRFMKSIQDGWTAHRENI